MLKKIIAFIFTFTTIQPIYAFELENCSNSNFNITVQSNDGWLTTLITNPSHQLLGQFKVHFAESTNHYTDDIDFDMRISSNDEKRTAQLNTHLPYTGQDLNEQLNCEYHPKPAPSIGCTLKNWAQCHHHENH